MEKVGVRFNDVLMNGVPVEYKPSTGTLILAGEEYSMERWLETRRRIDMLLKRTLDPKDWKDLRERLAWLGKRDRLPIELRDYEAKKDHGASSFLSNNLTAINGRWRGFLRRAPWWLRWRYDAVVTKESYRGD